jgi:tetratricopeptide (TPR) repeat protein
MPRRVPALRAARALAACALLGALPSPAAAGEEPLTLLSRGDAQAAVTALADAFKRGACDVWQARLYQDLRREAGQRDAVLEETRVAWPEPRGPLAQYLLARLEPAKDVDAALQRVIPSLADPLPAVLDQAHAAVAGDHLPRAATLVARLRKSNLDREEVALVEARMLEAGGQRAAAERGLATFVASHVDGVDARRAWVAMLLDLRRHADAATVAGEALARSRTPPLLVTRALVAREVGDLDTAKKCLDEAGDRGRPSLRAEAGALRAALLLEAGQVAAAEAAADAALAISPSSPEALRAKARCLEIAGKPREALERLAAALAARPGWGRAILDQAVSLHALREDKEARRAVAEARKRDPDLVAATHYLGVLEEEDGDWVGAEKAYRAALKQDPDRVETHRMLAGVLLSTGRLDLADAEALWILDRRPKDPEAWTTRGRVALRQDRLEDALETFGKAVESDPTYALGHVGRGMTLEEQDKDDEAVKAYEAAIAADAKLPLPHRYLGNLLDEKQDRPGALTHFRKYLELGGEDPDEEIRHAVERLSK